MCRVMQRRPLLDLGQTTTVMRVSALLPFGICPSDDLIRSPPAQKATLCCPCNSHFNHLASLYLPLACVAHAMQQRTTPPPAALSLSLSTGGESTGGQRVAGLVGCGSDEARSPRGPARGRVSRLDSRHRPLPKAIHVAPSRLSTFDSTPLDSPPQQQQQHTQLQAPAISLLSIPF